MEEVDELCDSGPFCPHWSEPGDCDLCREEEVCEAFRKQSLEWFKR